MELNRATIEGFESIIAFYDNNNWKCDTTTDPEIFWAKPEM